MHVSILHTGEFLRWMPDPGFDQPHLLTAELDHDTLGLRGIAKVDPERAVQDFVDLEVRRDFERALALVIGVLEALHGEDAEPIVSSVPRIVIGPDQRAIPDQGRSRHGGR